MKARITVIIMLVLFFFGHLNGQVIQVFDHQKISDTQGDFTGKIDNGDIFGRNVCTLSDVDGDGSEDIAVGATYDDDGATHTGAVWVLFLNEDGTVRDYQKISDTQGGFTGNLDGWDYFGRVEALGDFDGDGVPDMAVGAPGDNDGGGSGDPKVGAVWILFLNSNGTVKSHKKISDTAGGFTGTLDDYDWFGYDIANLGDLDGDDVNDIAVATRWDDDGGKNRGAVWILFLNSNGTVKGHQKISDTQGNFTGVLDNEDWFGVSVCSIGDFDSDGLTEIAVGAEADDDGGQNRGAVWVLFLNSNGTVKKHQKISDTQGNFTGTLDSGDYFGRSVSDIGDLDGDGVKDLVVGAYRDDDGDTNQGAVWLLYLNSDGTVKDHIKISETEGNFTGDLDPGDSFGSSVCVLEDLNKDGLSDIVVGAHGDDDGGGGTGAVWILFLSRLEYVDIDIKPGSCPNPLNVKSKGKLPVAILGSEDLDVYDVDVASVRLAGVEAIRSSYEDVAAPVADPCDCNCTTEGPDGYLDLTLKFATEDIVDAIGEV
ncbi:MAG: integrin alpha, partial [Planctomycetota bacterium]